jgi:hypothetical protein
MFKPEQWLSWFTDLYTYFGHSDEFVNAVARGRLHTTLLLGCLGEEKLLDDLT